MKSYHFSVIKHGIRISCPRIFRSWMLSYFTFIVIYPFIIHRSKILTRLSDVDLEGMEGTIIIKQQEEMIQFGFILAVLLFPPLYLWSLFFLAIYPVMIGIYFLIRWITYKKILYLGQVERSVRMHHYLSWNPFHHEAHMHCNNPRYLLERKIFGWIKYV